MNTIRHINIEITGLCNQRCFYCFNDSGPHRKSLQQPLSAWIKILKHLRCQGLKSILVTGGEPFVWQDTVSLLAAAQDMGLQTSILSNGFRIAELIEAHPTVFHRLTVAQISLDSMDPKVHNFRRGSATAWNDAIRAIEKLSEINVAIEISVVVSEDNLQELSDVANYAKQVNASLLLRPLATVGRAQARKSPSGFEELFEQTVHDIRFSTGVNVVEDRFFYAPIISDIDQLAFDNGIITIEMNGNIRGSNYEPLFSLNMNSQELFQKAA